MTLKVFQELVANKCDEDFSKIGRMILDGTKSDTYDLLVWIYLKEQEWISKISSSGHMKGGIIKILARMMKQIDACQQGFSKQKASALDNDCADTSDDGSNEVDFKDLDIHIEEIYEKVCVFQASALSVHRPILNSLPRERSHQQRPPPSRVTPPTNHKQTTPPSYEYGKTTDSMHEYLAFILIAVHKRSKILQILFENNINQFQMFKSLTVEDLKALGFNIAVISKLCNNVSKYKAHLVKTR
ncbi:hypothetical protein VP01_1307g1 [Puccinia sorghi]|uniref:Uncharacterized protein n=1 Tax=Puccinia sorghi TaxID=27349 RepID=A0A0L6VNJ1_9BASI|nr:hypothetical protein VP01_1307g1 [Puccinia sorghi]